MLRSDDCERCPMERGKLLVALIAPIGVAIMGLVLDSSHLLLAGLALTGLVLFAAVLRRMS